MIDTGSPGFTRYDDLLDIDLESLPAVHKSVEAGHGPCEVCGQAPAIPVCLRQNTGMLFWRTWRQLDRRLCRSCGLAAFRKMTNRTLVLGWWGTISFFVNWYYLVQNLASRARIARLAAPRAALGTAQTSQAADPGRSLFLRAGVWVFIGLLASAAVIGFSHPRSEPAAGSCVTARAGHLTGFVACSAPHYGRIDSVVRTQAACPSSDQSVGNKGGTQYLCINPIG
jgi:hypothetical protein